MKYPEYNYTELIIGGYGKGVPRNNIVKLHQVNKAVNESEHFECYRSHFRFTKDYYDYVKTVAPDKFGYESNQGYAGTVYSDFVWLDIDTQHEELPKALEMAQAVLNRLIIHFDINTDELVRCYFSGKKGFHIGVPMELFNLLPSPQLNAECHLIAQELAGDVVIDQSFYDTIRLFRLTNTRHRDTNLYKIELTPDEILTCKNVEEIKRQANNPRTLDRDIYPDEYANKLIAYAPAVVKPNGKEDNIESVRKADNWITDLLVNGASTGNRTNGLIRLAGYYKSKGIPIDISTNMLKTWDLQKNDPPLQGDKSYDKDKIDKTVSDIYKYQVEKEFEYITWEMCHRQAPAYIANMEKSRIKFWYPMIDENSGGLGPGEVGYIQAFTGVGKTALAQSIQLSILERQGIPSLMISLEMASMRLFFRMVGMLSGISAIEVERHYKNNTVQQFIDPFTKKPYNRIYTVASGPITIKQIETIYLNCPEKPGLVVIDYVGLMKAHISNPYERMSLISSQVVEFAVKHQVAVLGLVQTNRFNKVGEIELGMARDSGLIDADARIIIGLWMKEGDSDEFRKIKLMKASHGNRVGFSEDAMFFGKSARLLPTERRK